MKPPKKWKVAVVIWLAIYPLITIIFEVFKPLMMIEFLPLRTLLITVVVVPIMVFIILPTLQKLLAKWLKT